MRKRDFMYGKDVCNFMKNSFLNIFDYVYRIFLCCAEHCRQLDVN